VDIGEAFNKNKNVDVVSSAYIGQDMQNPVDEPKCFYSIHNFRSLAITYQPSIYM